MKKIHKYLLIILLSSAMVMLLTGAKLHIVELINTDSSNRLIDIEKMSGGDNSPVSAEDDETEETSDDDSDEKRDDSDSDTDKDNDKSSDKNIKDTPNTINITIRGKNIYLNSSVCHDNFETKFESLYKQGDQVELVDAYAEYHVYKYVEDYLKDQNIVPVN